MESPTSRLDQKPIFIPETLGQLSELSKYQLLELAVHILHIPLDKRTPIQQEALRRALQDVDFFKKMIADKDEALFEQCLQRINHESFLKDEVVCSIGDPGLSFYVLLKGQVSVSIYVQKGGESISEKMIGKKLHANKNFELKEVNVLSGGSHFGELALLNAGPRTATVKCLEDADFAVLTRADFREVLAKHTRQKIEQNVDFFQSLPLFDKSSRRAISTMLYHFKLLKLPRNYLLYRQGEEPTHLYIIKSGEVKIFKSVVVPRETDAFTKEDELRPPKPLKMNSELAILGTKEILGAEELYKNVKRESSAVVLSPEAEVFAIDKKDFEVRLSETDEFLTYFKNYCKKTLALRDTRVRVMISTVGHNPNLNWTVPQKSNLPKPKGPTSKTRTSKRSPDKKKVTTEEPNPGPTPGTVQMDSIVLEPVRTTTEPEGKSAAESPLRRPSQVRRTTENSGFSPAPTRQRLYTECLNPETSPAPTRQRLYTDWLNPETSPIPTRQRLNTDTQIDSPLLIPMTGQQKSFQLKLESNSRYRPSTQLTLSPIGYNSPVKGRNSRAPSNQQASPLIKLGTTTLNLSSRTNQGNKRPSQNTILSQKGANSKTSKAPPKRGKSINKTSPLVGLNETQEMLENFNRAYFTTKKYPPQREINYQITLVEKQRRLLDEMLKDLPPPEDPPRVNFLEDTPTKRSRKGSSPSTPTAMPRKNLSVMDRYKNLYIFTRDSRKDLKDPYEVNNIHLQARNSVRTPQHSRSRSFYRAHTDNNDSLLVSKRRNDSIPGVGTTDTVPTTRQRKGSGYLKYQDKAYLRLDLSDKNMKRQKGRSPTVQLTGSMSRDSDILTIKGYK